MSLILLRHTTPDVESGVCYGRLDLGVADTFDEEAGNVLERVPEVGAIVTSPLTRCRKLADHIARVRNMTVVADRRLQEIDFGRWEGQKWENVPRDELDAWSLDVMGAQPHGGESLAMVTRRVKEALNEHLGQQSERPALFVVHSGIIRVIYAMLDGEAAAWNANIAFGEHVEIERSRVRAVLDTTSD